MSRLTIIIFTSLLLLMPVTAYAANGKILEVGGKAGNGYVLIEYQDGEGTSEMRIALSKPGNAQYIWKAIEARLNQKLIEEKRAQIVLEEFKKTYENTPFTIAIDQPEPLLVE